MTFSGIQHQAISGIMTLLGPLSVFLTSLLAIPLAYICNQLSTMKDPVVMLIIGAVALVTVAATPYFLMRNKPQRTDNFFYGELMNDNNLNISFSEIPVTESLKIS